MYIFERELEAESESGKNRCIIIQFLDKNGFMSDAKVGFKIGISKFESS